MVKWIYKQLPEPATVVMTNLSVGECTGIHESPVQMNLVIQVGYWSHTVSEGRRLACRYGAVCGGASSQYCSLAQLCTLPQLSAILDGRKSIVRNQYSLTHVSGQCSAHLDLQANSDDEKKEAKQESDEKHGDVDD